MIRIFLFFICVFFSTLQAIYFRQISLAPFPLISFAMVFFFRQKEKLSKQEVKFLVLFFSIILISIIIGIINVYNEYNFSYYFPRLLGWIIFPISIISFRKSFKNFSIEQLIKVINWVLTIHLVFFFLQYIAYSFLNIKIDFLYSITGEIQRTGAAKLKEFSNSIRSSGLFTEPGSYSVYIYILIVVKFLLSKKIDLLILFALISMFLSYSMTGILMAVCFLGFYLFTTKMTSQKARTAIFLGLGLGIIILFKSEVFLGPIQERFLNINQDSSAETRFNSGIKIFLNNGLSLFGVGIGVLGEDISATSVVLGGLFDLGFVLFSIFILLNFFYIFSWSRSYKNVIFLIPILFSNISFNQIIYTVFFAFLTININEILKDKNENIFVSK